MKKRKPTVTELFIRGRKLNISLVFITKSYFAVPKDIRLNSTHYFIMKIPNKQELKQIAPHNSSDINIQDFMNLWKKYTERRYYFLNITVKESLTHAKQKLIVEEIANKRMEEIKYLSKRIDFNDLTYHYKAKNDQKTFIGFKVPLSVDRSIKEGSVS